MLQQFQAQYQPDVHFSKFANPLFLAGLRLQASRFEVDNVALDREIAQVCETLAYGVEGRSKTRKPVPRPYSFHPDHIHKALWTRALDKAGVGYRPLMQTRHTFATLMLSEGENIGWIQNMLGHSSLQMIFTKYYSWIPRKTRNDGSAFMRAYEAADAELADFSEPEPVLVERGV
jgi:integrase